MPAPHFKNNIITVAGLYYRRITNSSEFLTHLKPRAPAILEREPDNPADVNAVKVLVQGTDSFLYFVGYIPRGLAERLAPILDRGSQYLCQIEKISRLKKGPCITICLQTYPVSRIGCKPIPRSGRHRTTPTFDDPRSPTGKRFRQHVDFTKWSHRHDGVTGVYSIWSRDYIVYVGQAKNVGERWRQHFRNLINRTHHNNLLQADWTHRGDRHFRFDLLEEADGDNLDELEASYIRALDTWRNGYNSTSDGQGRTIIWDRQHLEGSAADDNENSELLDTHPECDTPSTALQIFHPSHRGYDQIPYPPPKWEQNESRRSSKPEPSLGHSIVNSSNLQEIDIRRVVSVAFDEAMSQLQEDLKGIVGQEWPDTLSPDELK